MTKSIDLYTKIILTVIALCLTYIVTKDVIIVPEAAAQSTGSRGYSAAADAKDAAALQAYKSEFLAKQTREAAAAQSSGSIIDVNIVSIAGKSLTSFPMGYMKPGLPVRIMNDQ
ncbi:MAG: hypothetical protein NT011_01715 [Kiritimatiellaeota bacterium]|nr:hypothetical protein [Kiritimatiellota bacterium]